ncbi:FadR/GntR family transcriptional regulator [Pseudochelatococcus contaminans]|uniref:DNA-binding FadR family transcriptional regulator n=1 Tax=Pseudochelatococcus contaminans TaxID=1538103 RepID=A0A7W5Z5H8_9HYPH|nr:FCD domain-containing protein [Pseudochelatococcus contaminans]MBB3810563.1 DNA-binding FadR family transcriptional regulator [Pseudochelatococcus contaminans]
MVERRHSRARVGGARVKRIKLSDQIADDLRRRIAHDKMMPGDRLPHERALTEEYGCAKSTMREALKALEVEGLLTMQSGPNGGPEVRTVSIDSVMQQLRQYLHFQKLDFKHVYELRRSLETTLAANVVGKLTPALFLRLEDNIRICEEANARGDRTVGRSAETEFHDILCEACDNVLLVFMCRFLNSLLRDLVSYRSHSLKENEAFGDHNVASHKALLEAYRAQDDGAVSRIMEEHMCCAEHFMLRLDASFHSDLLSRETPGPERLKRTSGIRMDFPGSPD